MFMEVLIKPHLSATAITKVRDAMVLMTDVTKVGEVYFKLAKYMFMVNPTLFHARVIKHKSKLNC